MITIIKFSLGSLIIPLSIWGDPPSITLQPADQFVKIGTAAILEVGAEPRGVIAQWYFNSNAIPGATNLQLHLPKLATNLIGSYYCRISSPEGSINSNEASISGYEESMANGDPTMTLFSGPPAVVCNPMPGHCPQNQFRIRFPQANGSSVAKANSEVHAAEYRSDITVNISYTGDLANQGCSRTNVINVTRLGARRYVFFVYFANPVPSGSVCALKLVGFTP